MRWLVEPELRVGLVRSEQKIVLGRKRGQALEELERGDGAGRIVRVVDPEDRSSSQGFLGDRVQVGKEAVRLEQRQLLEFRAREERAAIVDRIAGLRSEERRVGKESRA